MIQWTIYPHFTLVLRLNMQNTHMKSLNGILSMRPFAPFLSVKISSMIDSKCMNRKIFDKRSQKSDLSRYQKQLMKMIEAKAVPSTRCNLLILMTMKSKRYWSSKRSHLCMKQHHKFWTNSFLDRRQEILQITQDCIETFTYWLLHCMISRLGLWKYANSFNLLTPTVSRILRFSLKYWKFLAQAILTMWIEIITIEDKKLPMNNRL